MVASNLSYAQLKGLWLKTAAGTKYGTAAWATLMAAIAEAESGGNPGAVNPDDNGGKQSSYGLWQVSTGTHAAPSPNWADPATNASLALAKLQTQGPDAWGTYTSGAYKAYVNGATTPDPETPANPAQLDAETTSAQTSDCLYGLPGLPGTAIIGDIFGSGGNVGNVCIVTRSEARGIAGAALLIAGTKIMLSGAELAATYAGADVSLLSVVKAAKGAFTS